MKLGAYNLHQLAQDPSHSPYLAVAVMATLENLLLSQCESHTLFKLAQVALNIHLEPEDTITEMYTGFVHSLKVHKSTECV